MKFDPFDGSCPSPIEEGISIGLKDGLVAGREEGFKDGLRDGLISGKEFGTRLVNSILPLIQILQTDTSELLLKESAHNLLSEIGTVSLSNEEDPERETRLSQIESKIKALTVNFSKKVKNAPINRINKSSNEIMNSEINENSLTNHDAVLCKVSADQCGLLPDKFINEFVNHPHHHGHPRRHAKPPIINRGTFLRTISIDSIVRDFIEKNSKLNSDYQIISLGSGFDTRLFRFVDEFNGNLGKLKYIEIDFGQVIDEKRRIIEKSPILKDLSSIWHPISFDLNEDPEKLPKTDFNFNAVTLIISECCLMYLNAESGDNLISWISNNFKSSITFCSFDPILSDDLISDRFAKTMLDNFEARGLDTRALLKYPSRNSTIQRFENHFISVECYSMLQLEREHETEFLVSSPRRRQMAIKAALDEFEEWNLLANHYILIIAKK